MHAEREKVDDLPTYEQLSTRTDAPPGSSWGLFGTHGLGTVALLSAAHVKRAASLVLTGQAFNLDLRLDALASPVVPHRKSPQHVIYSTGTDQRDDYFDRLYCQAATHLDGLRHIRDHEFGNYNGVTNAAIAEGSALGIHEWAESGIVGRAVVIDVPRYLAAAGRTPLDHDRSQPIDVATLEQALEWQGVQREHGDIVLLRTGWLERYFTEFSDEERAGVQGRLTCAGLEQSYEMLSWLWDTRVSVIASDNPAVECYPPIASSPFHFEVPPGTGVVVGMMHTHLIARLGYPLGEMWQLDELAAASAADGRWDCMLVAKPLNIVGGVGSPANAMAIR